MLINYRADATTPERKRSLIRPIRGVPWWGVLAIYAVAIIVGMLLSLFTKELGIPFAVDFVICAVVCAVFAEFDALFTATVMPVLGYTIAYPLFYFLSMVASGQKGSKVAIIKIGIPFVTDVPVMLTALGLAAAVAIVRIVLMVVNHGWSSLWIVSLFMKKETTKDSRQDTARTVGSDKPKRTQSAAAGSSVRHTTANDSAAKITDDKRTRNAASTQRPTADTQRHPLAASGASAPASSASSEHRASTPRPRPMAHSQGAAIPRIAHPDGEPSGARPFQNYPGRNGGPQRRPRGPLTPEQRQRLAMIVAARKQGLDPRDPRVQQEMARRRAAFRNAADGALGPHRPYRPENGAARDERAGARPYPQRGARPPYSTNGNGRAEDPRKMQPRPAPSSVAGRPSYGPTGTIANGRGYSQLDRARRTAGRPYPDPRMDGTPRAPYRNAGGYERGSASAPYHPYREPRQGGDTTRGHSTR